MVVSNAGFRVVFHDGFKVVSGYLASSPPLPSQQEVWFLSVF